MKWYTVDSIVKGLLLKQRKPIHWYLEYLTHACDIIRELNFDAMRSVKTELLQVNEYKAITLPCGYVDWVRVGILADDKVKTIPQKTSLNRLNRFDNGQKVAWPIESSVNGYNEYLIRRTDYGEFTGGIFNHRPDLSGDFFKELKERGEIQFNADFPYTHVVLEYIGDGLDADSMTKVDPYAKAVIEDYITWQTKRYNRAENRFEAREEERVYNHSLRIFRARKNAMTKEDIINSVRKAYSGTYK